MPVLLEAQNGLKVERQYVHPSECIKDMRF